MNQGYVRTRIHTAVKNVTFIGPKCYTKNKFPFFMLILMHRAAAAFFFLFSLPSLGAAQLRISTEKDSVNFTKVKIGYSRDATIRVSNISLTSVDISNMTILTQNSLVNEFQIIVPQPPIYHIDSGDGRTIILRFKPSVTGIRTAALEIFTDDGVKEVELIGEGSKTQPDILMEPKFIDFGMLAPGEFKDTTILVIGGDKDSATIQWIDVANDNAAIYFDVMPSDPLVTFPFGVRSGDTVKLNARFTAFNSSGPRTGRTIMQGDVSGAIISEFRGEVGIADMVFSPQLLDLGIVPQGSSVDTVISIASIGEASVRLLRVDPPNLPYTISGVPSFPYSLPAGDSLFIKVHFDAVAPGDYEYPISAYSKNGIAAGLNRSALLKAFVIPRVLSKTSPQPFVVSCAIDSTYQRTLSISDTGNFAIPISGVTCSDPDFTANYPFNFPDTIASGSKRDIIITFKPVSGLVVTNRTCIVTVMTGSRAIVIDTIPVIVQTENARLSLTNISSTVPIPYTNTFGIVALNDLARYKLTSLKMEIAIDPSDIAEIDTQGVSIDKSIMPNAAVKITYDPALKEYIATITSSTILQSNTVIPFLHIPLRYFVAKDSSAVLRMAVHSPEKDGCLNFENDSTVVSTGNGCGDVELRKFLNNAPLISAVKITPNPLSGKHISVSFASAGNISLSSELFDITGKIVLTGDQGSFGKGKNMLTIGIPDIASGQYLLHLQARTTAGKTQDVFNMVILSH